MKKSYIISLITIVVLLTLSLTLTTSYGIWKITKGNDSTSEEINGCFEIVYENKGNITTNEIKTLNEENGKATTPYSIFIKNTCDTEKKAEIRFNIKDENTVAVKGLKLYVQGDANISPINYLDLKNSRGDMSGLSHSKILSTLKIKSGDTVRINIKMWIDEKIISNLTEKDILIAKVDVTDKESIILPTFKETILENNGGMKSIYGKTTPDFSQIANTNEGLYSSTDEDGTTYYFRGNVDNNYVKFANKMWRIVRINGNESVRLILEDTIEEEINYTEFTGDKMYSAYQYESDNIINSSNMKVELDKWFYENITKNNFDNYVGISNFCNDTNNYINNWHNYYQASARLIGDKSPQFTCDEIQEPFGGVMKSRVGLITADEVVFAGGSYKVANNDYYLNNGNTFYTITPRDYYNRVNSMFVIKQNGSLEEISSTKKSSVRPVISLKSNTVVLGNGTKENPYRIDEDANK